MATDSPRPRTFVPLADGRRWLWPLALIALLAGSAWLWLSGPAASVPPAAPTPQPVERLYSGTVATMDSPAFHYTAPAGWYVNRQGADPAEPPDPWTMPAGVVEFEYQGHELALQIAMGDYWGYLFATVDGQPANLLPAIPGNRNSLGELAGYHTFYAPEAQGTAGPSPRWIRIHRDAAGGSHRVRLEIWRSWGQVPLRAVAVDALPAPPPPRWPGMALVLLGGWGLLLAFGPRLRSGTEVIAHGRAVQHLQRLWPGWVRRNPWPLAAMAWAALATGLLAQGWWLCLAGLALLAYIAVWHPVLWLATLAFGLPFYFGVNLPLLPHRALGLIDVGVLGGVVLTVAHSLLARPATRPAQLQGGLAPWQRRQQWLLAALVSWALVSAVAAAHGGVALREWRTVFLAAGLFALALQGLRHDPTWPTSARLLLVAWLAGSTVVAAIGLGQYVADAQLIQAEGVQRIRSLYGSPNNLALYLERSLAVTLALLLFTRRGRLWVVWAILAGVQGAALLLTFSKGAIFLGLPAALVTLALAAYGQRVPPGQRRRILAWMAGICLLMALALTPFLHTARFQGLLDLRQGTGYLRLQLWRSAWQMALDHPLLGVGPDNFLYSYRSQYLLPTAWQEPDLNHPHNWILDWWTRLGLPGLALALGYFGVGVAGLWRSLRARSAGGETKALATGLLAAVAAGLAHGLIDASYALPDLMLVWVLIFYLVQSGVNTAAEIKRHSL